LFLRITHQEISMKKFTTFALALGLTGAAFAAPETYVIDPSHTFPSFSYTHLGFSTQTSRFDKVSGKVMFDKAAKTGAVDVTIDMTSVSTGSAMFNQHIQAEDFFDTAKHPSATFKSSTVKFDGDKPVSVDGTLTLKGVSKPVTLTLSHFHNAAHPMRKKDSIGADASVVVKRSEFNMGKNVPYVSDEVTIRIALEASAQ
jgi:polyisoprenoid-binding protein YceI